MKRLFSGAIASCAMGLLFAGAALQAQQAEAPVETFVLAKNERPIPPGGKLTETHSFEAKDSKLTIKAPGEKDQEGKVSFDGSETIVTERLTATRYRRTQTQFSGTSRSVVGGGDEKIDQPVMPGPLTRVPVFIEEKDGNYGAALQAGTPTPEQMEEIKLSTNIFARNDALVLYGDTPRKPGESWKVEPKQLVEFAGVMELSGSLTLQFVEVKEVGGVRCAVLKSVFDLKGVLARGNLSGGKISIKGEGSTLRSLADLVDRETKLEGQFTLTDADAAADPRSATTMQGTMRIEDRSTLVKP